MLKPGDIRRFKTDSFNVVGIVRGVRDTPSGLTFQITATDAQNFTVDTRGVDVTSVRLDAEVRDALTALATLDTEVLKLSQQERSIQRALRDNKDKTETVLNQLKNLSGILGQNQFDTLIIQMLRPDVAQKLNNCGFRVTLRSTRAAKEFAYTLEFSTELRDYRHRASSFSFVETEYDGMVYNCQDASKHASYNQLLQQQIPKYPFSAKSVTNKSGELLFIRAIEASEKTLFFSIKLECTILNGKYDENTARAIADLINKSMA